MSVQSLQALLDHNAKLSNRVESFTRDNRFTLETAGLLATQGLYYKDKNNVIICYVCGLVYDFRTSHQFDRLHKQSNCWFAAISNEVNNNNEEEVEILRTFLDWPYIWISPKLLTPFGFYYTGKNGICKCKSCHITVHTWTLPFVNIDLKQAHSANCTWVK